MRNWVLGGLAAATLTVAAASYHLYVLSHSAEHFRLLRQAPTVEGKRFHYREVHRFYHPWNPYRAQAERWLKEEGHEWEFLRREGRS